MPFRYPAADGAEVLEMLRWSRGDCLSESCDSGREPGLRMRHMMVDCVSFPLSRCLDEQTLRPEC